MGAAGATEQVESVVVIWSPSGPTVPITAADTQFTPIGTGNLGGIARVCNVGGATGRFTLGALGVTNSNDIPVPVGQSLFIAYGPQDTHVIGDLPDLLEITPGIGRS